VNHFGALRAIGKNFGDTVANETDRKIGGKSIDDGGKLSGCPPIVTIEKGNNFSAAQGNRVVEGRALSAVGLAEDVQMRTSAVRSVEPSSTTMISRRSAG
jgi:hypothetical protein